MTGLGLEEVNTVNRLMLRQIILQFQKVHHTTWCKGMSLTSVIWKLQSYKNVITSEFRNFTSKVTHPPCFFSHLNDLEHLSLSFV